MALGPSVGSGSVVKCHGLDFDFNFESFPSPVTIQESVSNKTANMGGPNLEVFKFGMYIMFPIGFMYYFGINLDSRFAVPDFWPKEGQTHKIPFDKEDITEELERLKQRRLAARARRLAIEEQGGSTEVTKHQEAELQAPRPEILEATKLQPLNEGEKKTGSGKGWLGWFSGK